MLKQSAILDAFWAPFGGSLGATYDVHLRLKRVVDFLLVLVEPAMKNEVELFC